MDQVGSALESAFEAKDLRSVAICTFESGFVFHFAFLEIVTFSAFKAARLCFARFRRVTEFETVKTLIRWLSEVPWRYLNRSVSYFDFAFFYNGVVAVFVCH